MNKVPRWEDAPKWARWVAMDSNGAWHWYEKEPHPSHGYWAQGGGQYVSVKTADESWRDTKHPLPGSKVKK